MNARTALKQGGVFLFDVWHGPAVQAQKPETRCASYADKQSELLRFAEPVHDPKRHRVDVHYRYFHRRIGAPHWNLVEETHQLRYWFPFEIQTLAESAGLRWLACEEWLSGHEPSVDTWGVCHVLQAP
jgi:hypothetical protein